jgi:hypothetical protein
LTGAETLYYVRRSWRKRKVKSDPDLIVAIAPDENTPPGKLPFWIVHALNSAGITTYSQLSNYDATAIMLIPGMTRAAVECIRAELRRRNLNLGPLVTIPAQKTSPEAAQACGGGAGGGDPRCPTSGGGSDGASPEAMASVRNVGLTSNWGTSDPTAPAPNGGWHAGLTAQVPPISATAPQPAPEQAFLRDQLAMAALNGLVGRLALSGPYRGLNIHEACTDAYALADEMLKVRRRGKEDQR